MRGWYLFVEREVAEGGGVAGCASDEEAEGLPDAALLQGYGRCPATADSGRLLPGERVAGSKQPRRGVLSDEQGRVARA